MPHLNYFEIEADSYYELGLRRGELFGEAMRAAVRERKFDYTWKKELKRARSYVAPTAEFFPHLIDEVHGYAEAARVCFEEAWALIVENELSERMEDKCTTLVTNRGTVIAHNEDWDATSQDAICILRRTVGTLSVLELYYLNSLGGNAVSINSHGFAHTVNTLTHTDRQVGVPRDIVGRWISETRAPEEDYQKLTELTRASGYHHTITGLDGSVWSIECSAKRQSLTKPNSPFVHTNHYLTDLSEWDAEDDEQGTRNRYRRASLLLRPQMSIDRVKRLVDDTSDGDEKSLFNERTIARVILDLGTRTAHVWLLREEDKGWLPYPLPLGPAQIRASLGTQPAHSPR
jgi:predicted choloylglycine hydrolase